MDTSKQLYTATEIAAILRITKETVWKKCRNREWPYMQVGKRYRFAESDLLEIQAILRPKCGSTCASGEATTTLRHCRVLIEKVLWRDGADRISWPQVRTITNGS